MAGAGFGCVRFRATGLGLGGATAALLSSPLPAFAKSKKKAEEAAIQKETARAAREAMKEYKSRRALALTFTIEKNTTAPI